MRRSATCLAWALLVVAGCHVEDSAEAPSASVPHDEALSYASSTLIAQIEARSAEHGFNEDDAWVLRDSLLIDELGHAIARFDRIHAGVRVVGGDIITSSKLDRGLTIDDIVSRLSKPITTSLDVVIDAPVARRIAVAGSRSGTESGEATLVLWAMDAHRERPRLAWDVAVGGRRVIVSADDGSVIDTYSTVHTSECGDDATCTVTSLNARPFYTQGTFSIVGARRSSGGVFVDFGVHDLLRDIRVRHSKFRRKDTDQLFWGVPFLFDYTEGPTVGRTSTTIGNGRLYDGRDSETSPDRFTPAAEVHMNLDRVYTFYAERYGRFGYAGRRTACLRPPGDIYPCFRGTAPIIATVNVPMVNAAFDAEHNALWFGYDYRGSPTSGPFVELDIVAHEFTHAVTYNTARLAYTKSESGALDESISDVFGRVVTFATYPETFDSDEAWWLGAAMTTPHIEGDSALRFMDDPARDGTSLAHMSAFPTEGIDAHYGSGIPNLAFVLVAQSIGWELAADIWYRALTTCFTESTMFHDARVCTVAAAEALHSESADVPNTVRSAWDEVGVY